ncbi:MAG: SRPBCC domain-containing protein [Acidimicrobiia bacterium]
MSFLRNSLRANGVFSLVTGFAVALFATSLATILELPRPVVYVVGVGTLLYGAVILWQGRVSAVDLRFALAVVAADALWVIGAIVVVAIPGSMGEKWMLVAVSAPVAVFAVLQSVGIFRATVDEPVRLQTRVEIDAEPSRIWDHLTDLESFSEWNPFVTRAAGKVAVDERLELLMGQNGSRQITIRPTVTEVVPNAVLEWIGHLGFRGIFDGRHRFELAATQEGTTMIHSEEFTGVLVPVLERMLDGQTKSGFLAMNDAIKERVEAERVQSG